MDPFDTYLDDLASEQESDIRHEAHLHEVHEECVSGGHFIHLGDTVCMCRSRSLNPMPEQPARPVLTDVAF